MRLAIMQPYFLSYIGYFQLINAVDKFIIYNDVNYIKQGWINRNRILLNGQPFYITLDVIKASSFKKINELEVSIDSRKLLKTINQAYRRAPYFSDIYPLIEKIISYDEINLSLFVTNSITEISKFLGIDTSFKFSSNIKIASHLKGQDRVIEICKFFNATEYINPVGGKKLYSKENFTNLGIELKFLQVNKVIYKQFDCDFIPLLSIVDVMMFNRKDTILEYLESYSLI